jgi:hypothetical protein
MECCNICADTAALNDIDLRQRVLRYSLRSPPADASWTELAVLFAALLGLPRSSAELKDQLQPPRLWCSDTVMKDTDVQLQALLRGKYYHAVSCHGRAIGGRLHNAHISQCSHVRLNGSYAEL